MTITFGNSGDNVSQGTHTFAADNNGDFLFVVAQGTSPATSGTYNGVGLTQIGTDQTNSASGRTQNIWGLVGPAQGSNTLTMNGIANGDIGFLSISGVDQTSVAVAATGFAKSAVGGSATPSQAVTTTVDGAYVIAAALIRDWVSIGANTTDVEEVVEPIFRIIRSTNAVSPAGVFTLNVNSTGNETTFTAVGINPAAGGGATFNNLTLLGVGT